MTLLRRRPLLCREAVELVTDYLDGALSRADRVRFERHLRRCEHCTDYLRQIREVVAASGRLEPGVLSVEAESELERLYRAWRAD